MILDTLIHFNSLRARGPRSSYYTNRLRALHHNNRYQADLNLVEYWQSLCLNYLDVLTNKVGVPGVFPAVPLHQFPVSKH